jgi:signal transduction histidine kinase
MAITLLPLWGFHFAYQYQILTKRLRISNSVWGNADQKAHAMLMAFGTAVGIFATWVPRDLRLFGITFGALPIFLVSVASTYYLHDFVRMIAMFIVVVLIVSLQAVFVDDGGTLLIASSCVFVSLMQAWRNWHTNRTQRIASLVDLAFTYNAEKVREERKWLNSLLKSVLPESAALQLKNNPGKSICDVSEKCTTLQLGLFFFF